MYAILIMIFSQIGQKNTNNDKIWLLVKPDLTWPILFAADVTYHTKKQKLTNVLSEFSL